MEFLPKTNELSWCEVNAALINIFIIAMYQMTLWNNVTMWKGTLVENYHPNLQLPFGFMELCNEYQLID